MCANRMNEIGIDFDLMLAQDRIRCVQVSLKRSKCPWIHLQVVRVHFACRFQLDFESRDASLCLCCSKSFSYFQFLKFASKAGMAIDEPFQGWRGFRCAHSQETTGYPCCRLWATATE